MSENPGSREHIHNVMLNATFYVGISKLMAKLECSKSAAVLYALNEGLFHTGVISQADYDLLAQRYGRKLKDVIAQAQTTRESSHVPVLSQEKQKQLEKEAKLKQLETQFRGVLSTGLEKLSPKARKYWIEKARQNPQAAGASQILELASGKGEE